MYPNEEKQDNSAAPVYDPFPTPRTYPEKWDLSELTPPREAPVQTSPIESHLTPPASAASGYPVSPAYGPATDAF